MPCTCPEEGRQTDIHTQCRHQIESLTQMLCFVMTTLELGPIDAVNITKNSATLAQWWTAHKAWDAAAKERERADAQRTAIRLTALNKLTPSEKAALGLNNVIP